MSLDEPWGWFLKKIKTYVHVCTRWFGQSKPGVATGTSVIYGREAPELQLRKMADLYFMFKMYKQAYNHYHTAKKDFQVNINLGALCIGSG